MESLAEMQHRKKTAAKSSVVVMEPQGTTLVILFHLQEVAKIEAETSPLIAQSHLQEAAKFHLQELINPQIFYPLGLDYIYLEDRYIIIELKRRSQAIDYTLADINYFYRPPLSKGVTQIINQLQYIFQEGTLLLRDIKNI